ncbi:wax ester/triacylglycerol synthase domain-containing protein [Mycobacterium neumannii]|uniref:wax ester/triacylglycerol synthase domain-containing protein n=1 Tax=Mycobacterium neumannii TaxID=2048551 RepID=UPI003AB590F4
MDNVLDPLDQFTFEAERATGVASMPHIFWVYDRPVDIDSLRTFQHLLRQGSLYRRVQPSPLPFGRHRWVLAEDPADIEIVAMPRPREELDAWLDEQATRPIDPEHGAGWHLAVLPFSDGGAAVSLVISHCLTDGIGLFTAIAAAADGHDSPISWPAAGSRRRWQALREDVRQTTRDIPSFGRGVAAAVRLARRARNDAAGAAASTRPLRLPADASESFTPSVVTAFVDAVEWDTRAQALGGTSSVLLTGLAAHLAQRMGRVTEDGSVLMKVLVNERVPGDTRANAISSLSVTVNPATATTDLREMRAAVKRALTSHPETRDDERAVMAFVPLLGLLPKRFVRLSDNTVVSSSLGAVEPAVVRPDGADADLFGARVSYPTTTKASMDSVGGVLYVLSTTALGRVSVAVTAYLPGCTNVGYNSNEALRQNLSNALNEFSLTGTYVGAAPNNFQS